MTYAIEASGSFSLGVEGNVKSAIKACVAGILLACSFGSVADAQSRAAQSMFDDAQRRAVAGSWTRALTIYERIIEMEPTWGQPAFEGALLSQRLNQYGRCALLLRHYIHVSAGSPTLGQAHAELEKCERRIASAGTLHVNATVPDGLEIQIDGLTIGAGQVRDVVLAPGSYTVQVEKLDHDTFTQVVEIAPGGSISVSPRLPATIYYGHLKLTVDQTDAVVAIDGKELGKTPLTDEGFRMLSGRYLLTIDKPGFHRWQRYIDIPRNGNYENSIKMLLEGARY